MFSISGRRTAAGVSPNGIAVRSAAVFVLAVLLAAGVFVYYADAAGPPKKPKSLSVDAISGPGFQVSFEDDSTDEDEFHIERSVSGGAFSEVATLTSTTGGGTGDNYAYSESSTTCGAEATYRVRSHRHSDDSFSSYASKSATAYLTTSSLASLAPSSTSAGTTKVALLGFTLTSCAASEQLQSVKVQYTGTASSDIAVLYLFRETDSSGGSFSAAGDTEMAHDTTASGPGEYHLDNEDFSMASGSAVRFYLVADIASAAATGNSIDVRVLDEKMTLASGKWPAEPDEGGWDPAGSTAVVVASSPPPPGGSGVRPTEVTFSGRAFPGASILVVDKDMRSETPLAQDVVTSESGEFLVRFSGILQSRHSFGFVIRDQAGRPAQSKFFNVNTISEGLVEKDILVSPTVDFVRSAVPRGENLTITGYASPRHSVAVEVDGTMGTLISAGDDGAWRLEVPTGPLEFGPHPVRVQQREPGGGRSSEFSASRSFTVSRLAVVRADFNNDSRIDIKDWSIFLSRWQSREADRHTDIDLNGDGRVDISDFSVFIRAVRRP